ncbi:lipoate--protein ligase family protein [Bacteroides sp.]|uniref:lipoate--protein ligase family protein n=1 Tax=Bacteroides sp. TaxID=29523 RepID=UPI002634B986|nr:lipoate--protein ligase family protein [Bacteroides sp.]MDD3037555.1 lipoate--protein ligase family protein [Bacteroides sp.]
MSRYINSPSTDIYFHLAAEEYLLKQGADDVFMLWQNTSSVVLGRHQRVCAEIDRRWAEQQQIQIARRFSGGGTVYHDLGNINLTFIETVSSIPDFTVYLQRTLDFLSSLGLNTQGDERLGIYLNKLKISGSAQYVYKNRVLYHCTMLYDTDLKTLNKVLNPGKEKNVDFSQSGYAVPSVKSEVTNICNSFFAGTVDRFKETTFQYFSQGQTASFFNKQELEAIYQLREEKYMREEWIFSR